MMRPRRRRPWENLSSTRFVVARRTSRFVALVSIVAALAVTTLAGCASVPQAEHDAALDEIALLSDSIRERDAQIATSERRIEELSDVVDSQGEELDRLEVENLALRQDLDLALTQLGGLREERRELVDRAQTLQGELAELRLSAEIADAADTADSTATLTSESRFADALAGRSGFRRVEAIGLRSDPRVAARFANASPGIGADAASGVPVLFDSRLDYGQTLVYLTISDPAGRSPGLVLTVQYASGSELINARAALVTITGADPVNPIDPIVLSDLPIRETDGTLIREAFTVAADRSVIDRLGVMLGGGRFTVTFVTPSLQVTHQPSLVERAAMSNILFAFIDLGGIR